MRQYIRAMLFGLRQAHPTRHAPWISELQRVFEVGSRSITLKFSEFSRRQLPHLPRQLYKLWIDMI